MRTYKIIRPLKIVLALVSILFLLCYILPLLIEALWLKPAPEIRNKGYREPLRVEFFQPKVNYSLVITATDTVL